MWLLLCQKIVLGYLTDSSGLLADALITFLYASGREHLRGIERACQPPETIDEEIAILKQEDAWLDQLQCLHGIPVDRLRQQLDEFRAECIANGKESHDSIADAKYHFNSWLRITIKNHTPDVTDKQKREAKRKGNILPHDAAKKKDYGSSF